MSAVQDITAVLMYVLYVYSRVSFKIMIGGGGGLQSIVGGKYVHMWDSRHL